VREIKLNFPVLGKKYGAQMKELAARVRAPQGAGREAGPAVKAGAGERPAPLVPDGEGRLKVDGFVLTADEYEIVLRAQVRLQRGQRPLHPDRVRHVRHR